MTSTTREGGGNQNLLIQCLRYSLVTGPMARCTYKKVTNLTTTCYDISRNMRRCRRFGPLPVKIGRVYTPVCCIKHSVQVVLSGHSSLCLMNDFASVTAGLKLLSVFARPLSSLMTHEGTSSFTLPPSRSFKIPSTLSYLWDTHISKQYEGSLASISTR